MSEPVAKVLLHKRYAQLGRAMFVAGETAAFPLPEAKHMKAEGIGEIIEVVDPQQPSQKAPSVPPKNKMVKDPIKKKGESSRGGRASLHA